MNSEEKLSLEKSSEIKTEIEEVCDSGKLGDLGRLIQEGMGRVRLTSGADVIDGVVSSEVTVGDENSMRNDVKQEDVSGEVKNVNENEVKNDTEKSGDNKDESSSSSSSSSDSDDDDDEEEEEEESDDEEEEEDTKGIKKVKGEVEMEEGEIRDFASDDEDGDVVKGPIRSKNEVQHLPPVPPVNVTIEPHHQTLPVGVVLSIIGAQVIVEGVENHNPLSEGSILWITESRSPLGVVDEIFGPVKNPYYMVRYNSETEVPTGIQQGSLISFVPEFADYVLNNNNLYKKGYDASGENDEELDDEIEFSDDEKEAEYKKMIKMSKRGSSEQKTGNTKKDKKSRNRVGNWKNDHQPSPASQVNGFAGRPPTSGPGVGPAFSPGPPPPNLTGPSGVWPNGFPSIQPQNMGFPPNGYPPNVPFMQQNFNQQPIVPFMQPFHPQFNTNGQMFPSNFGQGVPPNFGASSAFTSWPAGMPQNGFNQSQVGPPMAFQGFPFNPSMNVQPQGVAMPNGLQMENNGAMRPPMANGFPNRGGRKPFQRGGGRFRGGRSGQQSR
ncbi:hypothetical protein L6452_19375 [Arctium lappa]|uniref:Uncharacterized protein n=1 Tax=Arctium lappa TaxID=4217 RepID=A0ACB9B9M6_ARCLA|nr:hypothetical protein L6452_19375 [Arctium lappa]